MESFHTDPKISAVCSRTFDKTLYRSQAQNYVRHAYDNLPITDYIQSFVCSEFFYIRDKWVPLTTAWCVFRLRVEERSPIWRVAANIFNKQKRTADKGWSFRLGDGRGTNNSSP